MSIFLLIVSIIMVVVLSWTIIATVVEVLRGQVLMDGQIMFGFLIVVFFDVFFILNAIYLFSPLPSP